MARKVALFLNRITFVSYTIWLAPLNQTDIWLLVKKLLTLQWGEGNAAKVETREFAYLPS